uniref:Uncharacterized protein n=1 Tax=Chromera velia CCMP2878 TaxID=1169474 RepID=A0A0G4HKT4_9ALVE|eukprot:Cvel_28676.t1-p1 / transcript=Cvel_28676.t1 / gene=Cvel_28676 / organism=Chromera_velia_CCMP2878 / gene_product=hypothetical protein / transcript_product=hypothetical protein / location=Cvel_scaffold3801:6853-9699(-) / protein_length=389 / sequence_SO=supercontig / SO=protein_coding / is_pseudo=false
MDFIHLIRKKTPQTVTDEWKVGENITPEEQEVVLGLFADEIHRDMQARKAVPPTKGMFAAKLFVFHAKGAFLQIVGLNYAIEPGAGLVDKELALFNKGEHDKRFDLRHDKEREAQMAVEEKFLAGVKKIILLEEKHFPKAWADRMKEMRPPEPIYPACPKRRKQQTEKDESQTTAAQPSRRPRRNREEEATVEELNPNELFGEESEEGADVDSDEDSSSESGEGSSEDEDSSNSEDEKKKKKKKGKKGTETKKTESEEDDDAQQTVKKKSRRGAAAQARAAKPQTGVRSGEREDRLPHLRGNRDKTDNRRKGMLGKNQTSLEVDSLRQLAKEEEEKEKKKKRKEEALGGVKTDEELSNLLSTFDQTGRRLQTKVFQKSLKIVLQALQSR